MIIASHSQFVPKFCILQTILRFITIPRSTNAIDLTSTCNDDPSGGTPNPIPHELTTFMLSRTIYVPIAMKYELEINLDGEMDIFLLYSI